MTHFTKRIIALAFVLMALSLGACGQTCESYDNQGRCGTSTGAGKVEYSR